MNASVLKVFAYIACNSFNFTLKVDSNGYYVYQGATKVFSQPSLSSSNFSDFELEKNLGEIHSFIFGYSSVLQKVYLGNYQNIITLPTKCTPQRAFVFVKDTSTALEILYENISLNFEEYKMLPFQGLAVMQDFDWIYSFRLYQRFSGKFHNI